MVDKNIEAFRAGRCLLLQQEQDFNFQSNKNLVA
jgi:hypothetical protein